MGAIKGETIMHDEKADNVDARVIWKIADEISEKWKQPNYGAVPYITAMQELGSVEDMYYLDSGEEIVMRFLVNAQTWRGEDARRIKAELKNALKMVNRDSLEANINEAYRH